MTESYLVYVSDSTAKPFIQPLLSRVTLSETSQSESDSPCSPIKVPVTQGMDLHEMYLVCMSLRQELKGVPDLLGQLLPPTASDMTLETV